MIKFSSLSALHFACQGNQLVVYEKEKKEKEEKFDTRKGKLPKKIPMPSNITNPQSDFFVYVEPDTLNDKGHTEADLKSAYHIHVFITINENPPHEITKILPKSANWRVGEQVDLADKDIKTWEDEVHGMDSATVEAVRRFADAIQQIGDYEEMEEAGTI